MSVIEVAGIESSPNGPLPICSRKLPCTTMAADTPIRLVALDLDQTVFGMDLVVRPRVQAVISQVGKLGTTFTIATGRDPKLATRFARELGVTAPIICAQGGCIYDHQRDRVLHDVRLRMELLPESFRRRNSMAGTFTSTRSIRLICRPSLNIRRSSSN